MNLTKSLDALDKLADDMLRKSKPSDDTLSPEDISDASVVSVNEEGDGESEKDTKESATKKQPEKKETSEDEAEDEQPKEEAAEEVDTEDEDEVDEEEIKASVDKDFEDNDIVKKSMENSELASALVEVMSKSLSDLQYDVLTGRKSSQQGTEVLVKALTATMTSNENLRRENEKLTRRFNKLEKSISIGFEKVMDAIDTMSTEPARLRKSVVSVYDRDFNRSVNGTPAPQGFESLSKSQVLSVLNNELFNGNNSVNVQDIIGYESGAPLRPELQSLVASKMR